MATSDWHTDALRLQAEGMSSGKIAEALGQNRDAVKKYLARSRKDPSKALQTVVKAPQTKTKEVELSAEQERRVTETITRTEELRGTVNEKALKAIERALDMEIENPLAFKKAFLGIEYLKATKGPANVTVNAQTNTVNQINVRAEERRQAVHARLTELASIDA